MASEALKRMGGALPFFLFLILAVAAAIISLWALPERPLEQVLVFAIVASAMWFAARNSMPPHVARMLVNVRMLGIPLVLAAGTVGLTPQLIVLAWTVLQRFVPGLPPAPPIPGFLESTALLVIGCVFAIAFVRSQPRATAMGTYPQPWKEDFPEPNFSARLDDLKAQLEKSLDTMDEDANWSPTHFIPLEAEVEVIRPDGRTLEVADLYAALERHGDSRVFLLLGDPGAGKSVALRNLARQMIKNVQTDGRLPVYVNLKEWRRASETAWTETDPPTPAELEAFILEFIRRRIRLPSHEFLDKHYNDMIIKGRLFLLLDSFDEIPALMDAEDPRWLVRTLSQVVTQVLTGGTEARGLVASRLFRRPESLGNSYCRLDIRPFSEAKALQLITRITGTEETRLAVRQWVLTDRADMAVAARNPFLLGLLVDYAQRNPGREPENQYSLYDSFFRHSIASALRNPDYRGLHEDEIREVTERIAFLMFETERFGLEMPLERLQEALPGQPVNRVAGFLKHARLARSAPHASLFSFTHRRFNEFFLVRWFLADPERVWRPTPAIGGVVGAAPILSITQDGRWRDALVLYAQVAPVQDAARIAKHCVAHLQSGVGSHGQTGRTYMEGLQALRFLADSFRGQSAIIEPLQSQIGDFVRAGVTGSDILLQKHAVEALGLLRPDHAVSLIGPALTSDSFWVRETAFRACRYIPAIPTDVELLLRDYILAMPAGRFLKHYDELDELFSVVESFRPLRTTLKVRSFEARSGGIGILLLTATAPITPFSIMIFFISKSLQKIFQMKNIRTDFWQLKSELCSVLFSWFVCIPLCLFMIVLIGKDKEKLSAILVEYYIYVVFYAGFMALLLTMISPITAVYTQIRDNGIYSYVKSMLFGKVSLFLFLAPNFFLLMFLLFFFQDFFLSFFFPVYFTGGLLLLLFYGPRFCGNFYDYVTDAKEDTRILRRFVLPITKSAIASSLDAFRTSKGRLSYVIRLEAHANELTAAMSHADNAWPDGHRPNYGDEASSRLARLDERWLGLGR